MPDRSRDLRGLREIVGRARGEVAEHHLLGRACPAHQVCEEQRERMRSMRRLVSELNVYRWAGRMLVDAAEVRQRERMSGRLTSIAVDGPAETA